jgi:hypothetical protein
MEEHRRSAPAPSQNAEVGIALPPDCATRSRPFGTLWFSTLSTVRAAVRPARVRAFLPRASLPVGDLVEGLDDLRRRAGVELGPLSRQGRFAEAGIREPPA